MWFQRKLSILHSPGFPTVGTFLVSVGVTAACKVVGIQLSTLPYICPGRWKSILSSIRPFGVPVALRAYGRVTSNPRRFVHCRRPVDIFLITGLIFYDKSRNFPHCVNIWAHSKNRLNALLIVDCRENSDHHHSLFKILLSFFHYIITWVLGIEYMTHARMVHHC